MLFLDEDKWKTEAKTEEGAVQEYTISYQNLVPQSSYTFRVIAYNKYSISYPAESQDEVITHTPTTFNSTFLLTCCRLHSSYLLLQKLALVTTDNQIGKTFLL